MERAPNDLTFRPATRSDCALILKFIRDLAEYENMAGDVVATEESLAKWLYDKHSAETIFAVLGGVEVGFALYFTNFSTFLGRAGVYLEDMFVLPEYRGRGVGSALLRELARVTVSRGCGRLEWQCLDWNKPSIGFYESLGAKAQDSWTTYRLSGDALEALALQEQR